MYLATFLSISNDKCIVLFQKISIPLPQKVFGLYIVFVLLTCHLIGCRKNQQLCRNFKANYAEKCDNYLENTLDYAQFIKVVIEPF